MILLERPVNSTQERLVEVPRTSLVWSSLLVLALLSVPIVASPFFSNVDRPQRASVPLENQEWTSDLDKERENVVLGEQLWSASAGVWHLADGLWVRNGTVPDQGIALSPDGTMWLHTTADVLTQQLQEAGRSGKIRKVLIQPDGTVWACAEGLLLHFDRDSWTSIPMPTERGVFGCELAVSADGYLWVGTFNAWMPWVGGLARFDGTEWDVSHPLADETELPVVALSTGPDGKMWAVFVEFEEAPAVVGSEARFIGWAMASYDDEGWTAYTAADGIPDRFPVSAVATFDGAVWYEAGSIRSPQPSARGLVTFDGRRWAKYTEGQHVDESFPHTWATVWLAGPVDVLQFPQGG